MFSRFEFIGVTLLCRSYDEVMVMPVGHFLDQWEIYRQFNGLAKPESETFIDDIMD
jgi:hypothetical protein